MPWKILVCFLTACCTALVKNQPPLHLPPRLRMLSKPAGQVLMWKMLHGWCQPRFPAWRRHLRDVCLCMGTVAASRCSGAALTPALTRFQLSTYPGITAGCVFKGSQASPPAWLGGTDLRRTEHASDAAWRDAVPPEPCFPKQGMERLSDKQKPVIFG